MILIAAGSSLCFNGQEPAAIILGALRALGRVGRTVARSRLYASPAWPDPKDPEFVNAVAILETRLQPISLLAALQAIEAGYGRRRGKPNAPRTLDLDLIDYNGIIQSADDLSALELPHPRMAARDFVLAPLAEVAPAWRHPVSRESAAALLAKLETTAARPLRTAEALLQRNS